MTQILNVYALPNQVDPTELARGVVVLIDVLRASTTIVHALEAGARDVIPCLEVDEARAVADRLPAGDVVLGGERNGLRIDGFDVGNSPEEYTAGRVGRKTVVFTTTNGTRALAHARQADRVLIGAFVNATAVYEQLIGQERIHLLCAGTHGRISEDDTLLAGMLAERLQRQGDMPYEQNAQAVAARETWLRWCAPARAVNTEPLQPHQLAEELRKSAGGKHLIAVGMDKDILAAARIDRFAGVPELDPERIRIRLM